MVRQRRTPFSGKKKKEQMQAKRNRVKTRLGETKYEDDVKNMEQEKDAFSIPTILWTSGPTKLRTIFFKESKDVIAVRKKDATRSLQYVNHNESPYDDNGIGKEENELGMPKRPKWDKTTTPDQLEEQEKTMFLSFIENIYSKVNVNSLNYFEHNLEVWRQLWRTIEKSDILLFLVDGRFPLLNFNISLYHYITDEHKKEIVLLVNKCDLVPQSIQDQWRAYLENKFPKVKLVFFQKGDSRKKILQVLATCSISRNNTQIPALPYFQSILQDSEDTHHHHDSHDDDHINVVVDNHINVVVDSVDNVVVANDDDDDEMEPSFKSQGAARDTYVVIGTIGEPNMGKSTVINCIFEKVVVSHSATPGHTKHFQTLFLSKSINFCDCPGVVFPKVGIPRELQVLFGSYPIAQTQEPYSAIRYLAERCEPRLDVVYGLQPYDMTDTDSFEWTPYHLCESYAYKRGYCIKGGKLDVYRAANQILRHALSGVKVSLYFAPPNSCSGTKSSPMTQSKEMLSQFHRHHANTTTKESDVIPTTKESDEENHPLTDETSDKRSSSSLSHHFACLMDEDTSSSDSSS